MKYKKYILFSFYLFSNIFSSFGQDIDIEQLFEDKEYSKVIAVLLDKDTENKLSLRDYYLLTKSYGKTKRYTDGLVYSNEMIKECLKRNDTTNLTKAYNLKAENLIDLNQIKPGIKFCESVSPTFRKQDSVAFQLLCFKWGMLYHKNKEFQKAYDTYNKITLKKYRNLFLFDNNYAIILEGLGKYNEAIKYSKKAVQKIYDDHRDVVIGLTNIAIILQKQMLWEEARVYLDSAENSISKNTPLRSQKYVYERYYEYHQITKNTFYASIYLEFINDINEEIFNKRFDEEIQALKTSHKRETLLDNKLETSRKEKLWGTIILLFIIIVLLSILYLFKYRNIKAAHKTVMTEQKLLRSQMTPHFIFNSLSVLQGMILNKEDNKAVRYLSKFSKLLRLILENSREKLVPIDEELKTIQNYVDLHNMRSEVPFKFTLDLDENLTEDVLIPPMLIQPFVENAIEHGFNKDFKNAEISIEIIFKDKMLVCVIKDNGIGLNARKLKSKSNKKSLSTRITSERLKIFSKEYKVKTEVSIQDRSVFNEQGTQINLTLPYKIDQDA